MTLPGGEAQGSPTWTAAPGPLAAAGRQFVRHRLALLGLGVLGLFLGAALFGPLLVPYAPEAQNLGQRFSPSTGDHWLGTDELGRDVLSRLVHALRVTCAVTLLSTLLATVVGVSIGMTAGFFGGWVEAILMRWTDVMLTLPVLALALALSKMLRDAGYLRSTFGAQNVSLAVIVIVLTAFGWMTLARLVHGTVLSLKQRPWVEAARAMGASPWQLIRRHLLPHTLAPVVVQTTLQLGYAVVVESTLSFLGLGITPPNPSLGNMLTEAQGYMFQNPWLAVYPGAVIFFMVLAVNFVGDALRDAVDPYFRRPA